MVFGFSFNWTPIPPRDPNVTTRIHEFNLIGNELKMIISEELLMLTNEASYPIHTLAILDCISEEARAVQVHCFMCPRNFWPGRWAEWGQSTVEPLIAAGNSVSAAELGCHPLPSVLVSLPSNQPHSLPGSSTKNLPPACPLEAPPFSPSLPVFENHFTYWCSLCAADTALLSWVILGSTLEQACPSFHFHHCHPMAILDPTTVWRQSNKKQEYYFKLENKASSDLQSPQVEWFGLPPASQGIFCKHLMQCSRSRSYPSYTNKLPITFVFFGDEPAFKISSQIHSFLSVVIILISKNESWCKYNWQFREGYQAGVHFLCTDNNICLMW